MTPYFSIIMPVYNVEEAFPASFESVLRQDDRDFEVILVDDGSTDSSGRLCDEYAARYDFVRVIHKPNGGLASARNAGLEQVRGRYILMPDSDDLIEPDTLSFVRGAIQAAALRSDRPVDMVRFDYFRHEGEKVFVRKADVPEGLYAADRVSELLDTVLLDPQRYPLSACSHAYRREFLEDNGLRFVSEREVLSEDFLFLLCAMMTAESIYVLDKPLYHYISRVGSLTNSYRPNMLQRYTKLYDALMDYASRHGADEQLKRKLSTYYIVNLVYGNCIVWEYRSHPGDGWQEARQNVRTILRDQTVKTAAGNVSLSALPVKDIVRVLCIRLGWEAPFAFSQRQWKNRP